MSKVSLRWGKGEWEVERTELSSLQALKQRIQVGGGSVGIHAVETDRNQSGSANAVLQRPLHYYRGTVL